MLVVRQAMKKPRKLYESLAADLFQDAIDRAGDDVIEKMATAISNYKNKFNRSYMSLLRMPFFRDLVDMIKDEFGYRFHHDLDDKVIDQERETEWQDLKQQRQAKAQAVGQNQSTGSYEGESVGRKLIASLVEEEHLTGSGSLDLANELARELRDVVQAHTPGINEIVARLLPEYGIQPSDENVLAVIKCVDIIPRVDPQRLDQVMGQMARS